MPCRAVMTNELCRLELCPPGLTGRSVGPNRKTLRAGQRRALRGTVTHVVLGRLEHPSRVSSLGETVVCAPWGRCFGVQKGVACGEGGRGAREQGPPAGSHKNPNHGGARGVGWGS